MTYLAFVKAILSDELSELGSTYGGINNAGYKGPIWYKLIDNMIYLTVESRLVSHMMGLAEIWFTIGSLLTQYHPFGYMIDWQVSDLIISLKERNLISELAKEDRGDTSEINGITSDIRNAVKDGANVWYDRRSDEKNEKHIKHARAQFRLSKQLIAGVSDLESCFNAKQRAGYLSFHHSKSQMLGKEYTEDDWTEPTWPDDAYFILCLLGRIDDAARYIEKDIASFEGDTFCKPSESIILDHRKEWVPYVELAKNRKYDEIRAMMLRNYNANCDRLETERKIVVDQSKWTKIISEWPNGICK